MNFVYKLTSAIFFKLVNQIELTRVVKGKEFQSFLQNR